MRTAIEKILKNFVLRDVKGARYSIGIGSDYEEGYRTCEIYIYLPSNFPREEVLILKERLERALSSLGFRSVFGGLYDYKTDNVWVIKVRGRYKSE